MPLLRPSWQLSASLALALAAAALLLRRRDRRPLPTLRAFAAEFALIMGLLGVWQFVGQYVRGDVAAAMHRAQAIADVQRVMHLPDEAGLQHLVLPHPQLIRAANEYYAYAHLNTMAFFLLWMWWRHRDRYPDVRATVVATTAICLLVQLVPVAPPRLMPELGFTDTALDYGQSVYGTYADGLANQLSAMPSVHVAWALIVAWFMVRATPSRWRWVGPAHAALTVLVITVTANHWWLDGIVAALILLSVEGARAALGSGPRAVPVPLRLTARPTTATARTGPGDRSTSRRWRTPRLRTPVAGGDGGTSRRSR
jgi:drug/metabolite transporter superfamily protein YnfA